MTNFKSIFQQTPKIIQNHTCEDIEPTNIEENQNLAIPLGITPIVIQSLPLEPITDINTIVIDDKVESEIKSVEAINNNLPNITVSSDQDEVLPTEKPKNQNIQKQNLKVGPFLTNFPNFLKPTLALLTPIMLLFSIMIILLGIIWYPSNINIDDQSLKQTSETTELTSQNPFYIYLNNVKYISYNNNGKNAIKLGKIDGINNIKYGNMYQLGPIGIESWNNKILKLERDYNPVEIDGTLSKFYETKDARLKLRIKNNEKKFKVIMNNSQVFEEGQQSDICSYNNGELDCIIQFGDTISKYIKLEIKDNNNNNAIIFDGNLELIKPSTLICNKKQIESEGKINCTPNFDGNVKIKDKNISVRNSVSFEYPEVLDDGQQKVTYTIQTLKDIKKDIIEEYTVNKQILDVQFKTVIDTTVNSTDKPLIILQATPSTDSTLAYSGSFIEDVESSSKKIIVNGLTTQFSANQKGVISSEIYNTDIKNNITYKLKFTNKAGRTSNYSCIRNYNQKEFVCAKN
jgi:hypothetical protein